MNKKECSTLPFIGNFSIGCLAVVYLPPNAIFMSLLFFLSSYILLIYFIFRIFVFCFRINKKHSNPKISIIKNRVFVLMTLLAGVSFGAFSHKRVIAESMCLCLGLPSQTALEGSVVTDPRKTASGLWAFELKLKKAFSNDGAWASASGRINVYSRKAPEKGQTVVVGLKSGLSESRKSTDAWQNILALPSLFIEEIFILDSASKLNAIRTKTRTEFLKLLSIAGSGTKENYALNKANKTDAGPLLEALILGVKDELDPALSASFKNAGCSHILALSGQHVAILAALLAVILGKIVGPHKARWIACFISLVYLWLVGVSPSVLRAVIMFCLSSIFTAMDRQQSAVIVLAWTFVITLGLYPSGAYSLSFKLSYLAVLGIALFNSGYEFFLRRWITPPLSGALASGFAALAATAPLSVITFGKLNLLSPLWSALAGTLVTALMWGGLTASAGIALISGICQCLEPFLGLSIKGIAGFMVNFCAGLINLAFILLERLMKLASCVPSIEIPETNSLLRFLLAALLALSISLLYILPNVPGKLDKTANSNSRSDKLRCSKPNNASTREAGFRHAQEVWTKLSDLS